MNTEQLDNIHFLINFTGFLQLVLLWSQIPFLFLTAIYQNREDMDSNLNKVSE